MSEQICPQCGDRNVADAQFCASCGSYLGWDADSGQIVADSVPAYDDLLPAGHPPEDTPATPWYRAEETLAAPRPRAAEVSGTRCRSCSTVNPSGRRFCTRCGEPLARASMQQTVPFTASHQAKKSWTDRILPSSESERTARREYRRSLPLRYQVTRVVMLVVVVAAIAGVAVGTHGNPIGWTKREIKNLRGTLVAVPVTPTAVPPNSVASGYDVGNVADGHPDTAWASVATSAGQIDNLTCGTSKRQPGILLTASSTITVRALDVTAGLPTDNADAPGVWRPAVLELWWSPTQCVRVTLKDTAAQQRIKLKKSMTTQSLYVSVVGSYPVHAAPKNLVAISEITLLTLS